MTQENRQQSEPLYDSDSPVSRPEEDRFGRSQFAERLADALTLRPDHSSLIVGIYGAWGTGKTSVLNLLRHYLKERDDIICYRFNPWRFPDEATLLAGFFEEMARKLGKSLSSTKEKVGKLIREYGTAAASTVKQDKAASILLGRLFSTPSLEDSRDRLNTILAESNKLVVVLLDDLDRLARPEIQAVMRLLKLTADFPNTAYVVALDPDIVAGALDEQYSGPAGETGRAFLEKIIQVPVQLPAARAGVIHKYFSQMLDQLLRTHEIELSSDTDAALRNYFSTGLHHMLRTPRDAKRYINVLSFTLPLIKTEVNIADLIAVEGLGIFYPDLYRSIRENSALYLGTASLFGTTPLLNEEAAKEKLNRELEDALNRCSQDEQRSLTELIKDLFPMTKRYLGSTGPASPPESWYRDQRIASSDYFQKFFSYGVAASEISDLETEQLLQQCAYEQPSEIARVIKDLVNKGLASETANQLIWKIRARIQVLNTGQARTLIRALGELGAVLPELPTSWELSPLDNASILATLLLRRLPNKDRLRTANETIEKAQPAWFAAKIYSWLDTTKDEDSDAFEETDLKNLKNITVERLKKTLAIEPTLIDTESRIAVSSLRSIAEWESKEAARSILEPLIIEQPERAISVIRCVLWVSISNHRVSDFRESNYPSLAEICTPSILAEAIGKALPGIHVPDEFPRRKTGEELTDEKLAAQFLWFHQRATKETDDDSDSEERYRGLKIK